MKSKKNKGVFLCKGKRVHIVYDNVTLHMNYDDFEKFHFMVDDAYYRIKSEFPDANDSSETDDDSD